MREKFERGPIDAELSTEIGASSSLTPHYHHTILVFVPAAGSISINANIGRVGWCHAMADGSERDILEGL